MVEPDNQYPQITLKDEDHPDHLAIVHLGAWPLFIYTIACLVGGGFIGGVCTLIVGYWSGWCR